jgi:hypothetical protein
MSIRLSFTGRNMFLAELRRFSRQSARFALAAVAAALFATQAPAAFHLWSIQQIYSNADGTLQYIELGDVPPYDTPPFGGFQNFINGMSITASNGTSSNVFTIPGGPLPLSTNTLGHMLLFSTAAVQGAGGPAPDYILPDNFLFSGGGSITFFGANGGAYGAIPTDGSLAYNWTNNSTLLNSPTNFAGQTGTIGAVPEPSSLLLSLAAGSGLYGWVSSRRRARRAATVGVAPARTG